MGKLKKGGIGIPKGSNPRQNKRMENEDPKLNGERCPHQVGDNNYPCICDENLQATKDMVCRNKFNDNEFLVGKKMRACKYTRGDGVC